MKLNSADIIFEKFDNEIVVINLKTGIYYGITGSGTFIWEMIEKNFGSREIISLMESRFKKDSKLKKDIDDFIETLLEEKLILKGEDIKASYEKSDLPEFSSGETDYVKPNLERFTDQQELLLLDPIHEVDDFGWPRKK